MTEPGSWEPGTMHWVMPPDMAPMELYMLGPGDMLPPIPWCGELSACIGGLGGRVSHTMCKSILG